LARFLLCLPEGSSSGHAAAFLLADQMWRETVLRRRPSASQASFMCKVEQTLRTSLSVFVIEGTGLGSRSQVTLGTYLEASRIMTATTAR